MELRLELVTPQRTTGITIPGPGRGIATFMNLASGSTHNRTVKMPPLFDFRCAIISHIRAGHTFAIHCERGSMAGRFVNIIIPGTKKTLGLCEVEVYGAPERKSATLSHLAIVLINVFLLKTRLRVKLICLFQPMAYSHSGYYHKAYWDPDCL